MTNLIRNTKKTECRKCKTLFLTTYTSGLKNSKFCTKCQREKQMQSKTLQWKNTNKKTKITKKKPIKKLVKTKKPKSPTLKKLTKILDQVFSIYIRKSSADKNGFITCACCQTRIRWEESQNMHYISRSHRATRWDEMNCHAGCLSCNVFKNGNYPAYTQFYLNNYGQGVLQSLLDKRNLIRKFTTKELSELIEIYKKRIENL